MAYAAHSATIGSAGAHHISRDTESTVVRRVRLLALGIGDDRNRHFTENLATARSTLKSKDAIPVNYCTRLCF
jgi:hypothetical protein